MKSIYEIFAQYPGTDKVHTLHSYGEFYSNLLESKRLLYTNILEVGVRDGSSLKAWRDYFPNATIYGIDNGSENGIWISDDEERIKVIEADTFKPETITASLPNIKFDLIVDDGCHSYSAQLVTFGTLRPYLNKGGLYVVEDIEHCADGERFAAMFGGVFTDRRKVKGRHDDMLVHFTN